MKNTTPGISRDRQTLFWIRDQLRRAQVTTVSISPQEAGKLADEVDNVIEGREKPRPPRF